MEIKQILIFFLFIYFIGCIVNFMYRKEKFEPMGSNNHMSILNSTGKTVTTYKDYFKEKKCCLVKKVFNEKKDKFEYTYKPMKECNIHDQKNNHNEALFIDGVNGWKHDMCRKPNDIVDKDYLGSCKRINFECKDFVTKSDCKKFNMEWSDKTCQTRYNKPFQIKDRKIEFGSKILKV